MGTSAMKEQLYYFIENSDDRLVKMLYAVAKEYTEEDEYVLSDEDIEELDRRSAAVDDGTSKTYSWSEAKKIITGK